MSVPKRFTRKWVRDNAERFKELSKPPEECPICMEKMKKARSPLLGDYPTSCRHFCCRECWLDIFTAGPPWKCPVCREDVSQWLGHEFNTTVRVEPIDKDLLRMFVMKAVILLDEQGALSPRMFQAGSALLEQAAGSDDDDEEDDVVVGA